MGRIKNWHFYLVAFLALLLLFFPLCRQLIITGQEQKLLAEKIAQGQRAQQQLAQIMARKAEIQKQLKGADKVQPSDLLADLIAHRGPDVSILSLAPGKMRAAGGQVILPLALELEGNYPALLDTIYRLNRAQRNWVLRSLSLEGREGVIKAKIDLWVPVGGDEG